MDGVNATFVDSGGGIEWETTTLKAVQNIVETTKESPKTELKWVFMLHTYGFGCLFFVLAFYAFFSILNLRSLITPRPFMTSINTFICVLGAARAGCLFIDPYNLEESLPKVMGYILWDIGFPSIIAAFTLIQLAFLQLTQVGPSFMRKKSYLTVVITAHFSCVIGSDIGVIFLEELMALRFVVQTLFLCWGIFLCCMFLYAGYKVMALLKLMPKGTLLPEPDTNQKGIMQLSVLAPYNNLASCLTAALMPTLMTPPPRIRISDENDQSISQASDGNITQITKQPHQAEPLDAPARIRRASPNARRKSSTSNSIPSVYVRPPTPTAGLPPSINLLASSRRESITSHKSIELSPSRRGSNTSCSRCEEELEAQNAGGTEKGACPSRIARSPSPSRRHTAIIVGAVLHSPEVRLDKCNEVLVPNVIINETGFEGRRSTDDGSLEESRVSSTVSLCSVWCEDEDKDEVASSSKPSIKTSTLKGGKDTKIIADCIADHNYIQKDVNTVQKEVKREIKPYEKSKYTMIADDDNMNGSDCQSSTNASISHPKLKGKTSLEKLGTRRKSRRDDGSDEESTIELLPQPPIQSTDVTLDSILNHIAYVNRAPGRNQITVDTGSRKSQVRRVLHVTYATAILGLVLCIVEFVRLLIVSAYITFPSKSGFNWDRDNSRYSHHLPWSWFLFQTLCRGLEFAMGCAMANITKQPANNRHPHLFNHSLRLKHRESLYL